MTKSAYLLVAATVLLWSAPRFIDAFEQGSPHRDPAHDSRMIDRILEKHWQKMDRPVNVSPRASDEVFLRRIYLDVAGRIPSVPEARRFLGSPLLDKRAQLIDELLKSEGYVNHYFHFWADILRVHTRLGGRNVTPYYVDFIRRALRENMPYDKFVRSLITGQGSAAQNGAAGYNLRDRGMPLDRLSNTVRVFLGTRLECAQCHDHPFDEWTQLDFYQLAAFTHGLDANNRFYRLKLTEIQRSIAKMEMDPKAKAALRSSFQEAVRLAPSNRDLISFDPNKLPKLPHDYQYANAQPHQLVQPALLYGENLAELAPADKSGNGPDEFARWLTSPQNPRFAAVIANRLWKKVTGKALIEPVDDIGNGASASHPELIQALSSLIVDNGYDIKHFLRVLFRTRLYQSEAPVCDPDSASGDLFLGPLVRRLTAEQIWDSLVTLTNPYPELGDWKTAQNREMEAAHGSAVRKATGGYDPEELLEFAQGLAEFRSSLQERRTEISREIVEARRSKDTEKSARLNADLKELQSLQRLRIHQLLYRPEFGGMNLSRKINVSFPGGERGPLIPAEFIGSSGKLNTALLRRNQTEQESKWIDSQLAEEGVNTPADKRDYLAFLRAAAKMKRAVFLDSPAPNGHFLREFGQSDREMIENASQEPGVPQKLELLNGSTYGLIVNPRSVLSRGLGKDKTFEEKTEWIFLGLLSRLPTPEEAQWISEEREQLLDDPQQGKADQFHHDLIFALLNSSEFLFIR